MHSTTLAALFLATSAFAQGPQKQNEVPSPDDKLNPPSALPFPTSSALLVGGSDDCSTPDAIVGAGPFTFDTTAATTGTQGQNEAPCLGAAQIGIQRDVWFVWTSGTTGQVELNSCGGTTMDTKVAIYPAVGCPLDGTVIACNDDAAPCGLQSRVLWNAVAGTSYLVQFGRFPTTSGAGAIGTFQILDAAPPANDTCAAPVAISGSGPFAFNTSYATTGTEGQGEAPCLSGGQTGIGRDLWFTWTAGFTGTAQVRTCSTTTLDTKIAVHAGGACPSAGSVLACNDDACGTQAATLFACTSGASYLVQLGQDPTNTVAGGSGTFSIVDASPPSNDACATPLAIGGSGPFAFDTTFATTGTEGQADAACLFAGTTGIGGDTWFTWTPAQSGTATLSFCTLASGTDTKAAVYAGAGCPTAGALACDDDTCNPGLETTLTFAATCGQVYTIQVGKYPTTAGVPLGSFTLSVASGPTCSTFVPFCFGDGTATACPCGNNGAAGNGCSNSLVTAGANLAGSGTPSLAGDTVVLAGTGMPNATCLYFQGTTQLAGGAGAAFGDGLRCAGGTIIRLGTKTNASGASQYPTGGDLSVSQRGLVTVPGDRTYQVWYRNAAAYCTVSTFNLSNGVQISWAP